MRGAAPISRRRRARLSLILAVVQGCLAGSESAHTAGRPDEQAGGTAGGPWRQARGNEGVVCRGVDHLELAAGVAYLRPHVLARNAGGSGRYPSADGRAPQVPLD